MGVEAPAFALCFETKEGLGFRVFTRPKSRVKLGIKRAPLFGLKAVIREPKGIRAYSGS